VERRLSHTILSLSGACEAERLEPVLLEAGLSVRTLDLRKTEGTVCYCDPSSEEYLSSIVRDIPLSGVHYIDSGDYHYLSALFLERISEPFDLLLFDHHPDMQDPSIGDILSCGGWVGRCLSRPDIPLRRVHLFGMDPSLEGETLPFGDRVSLGALPKGDLPIYVSIDKDALSREWAATNWDQGEMSLGYLTGVIEKALGEGCRIAGVDICGEISPSKGGRDSDFSLNARTNLSLGLFFEKEIDYFCCMIEERKSFYVKTK